jgi:hypothetical protein
VEEAIPMMTRTRIPETTNVALLLDLYLSKRGTMAKLTGTKKSMEGT